jgi:mono/diheme cytochrome c family protein
MQGRKISFEKVRTVFGLYFFACCFFVSCSNSQISQREDVSAQKERDLSSLDEDNEWYKLEQIMPDNPVSGVVPEIDESQDLKKNLVRGRYLVTAVAACGVCHSSLSDPQLSGGKKLIDSYGEVYVPNITPDEETGIGAWKIHEIMQAIRASIGKGGNPLSLDVHSGYRWLSDSDARAISLYLLSQKPVTSAIQRRELGLFSRKKLGIISRHNLVSGYVPELPSNRPVAEYGRYLALHVSNCGVCHSPGRAVFSGEELFSGEKGKKSSLLGTAKALVDAVRELDNLDEEPTVVENKDSFNNLLKFPQKSPNIRGGLSGGLYSWKEEDILKYISTGVNTTGTKSANCPTNFYQGMTEGDKKAIAAFLKTLN